MRESRFHCRSLRGQGQSSTASMESYLTGHGPLGVLQAPAYSFEQNRLHVLGAAILCVEETMLHRRGPKGALLSTPSQASPSRAEKGQLMSSCLAEARPAHRPPRSPDLPEGAVQAGASAAVHVPAGLGMNGRRASKPTEAARLSAQGFSAPHAPPEHSLTGTVPP